MTPAEVIEIHREMTSDYAHLPAQAVKVLLVYFGFFALLFWVVCLLASVSEENFYLH